MKASVMKRKRRKADPLVRFEAKYIPEPNSGCWLWVGALDGHGYGTFGAGGRDDGTVKAYRWSYERFKGPVPVGLDLDHLCRVRCCVNPDHLEAVTRSENLKRSPLMGRQQHKTACPLGHKYTGLDARGSRICRVCINERKRQR